MSPKSLYMILLTEYLEFGLLCDICIVYVFMCEQPVKMSIPGADECKFKGAYSTGLLHSNPSKDMLHGVCSETFSLEYHPSWATEILNVDTLQFQSARVIRPTTIVRLHATRARRPARHCFKVRSSNFAFVCLYHGLYFGVYAWTVATPL